MSDHAYLRPEHERRAALDNDHEDTKTIGQLFAQALEDALAETFRSIADNVPTTPEPTGCTCDCSEGHTYEPPCEQAIADTPEPTDEGHLEVQGDLATPATDPIGTVRRHPDDDPQEPQARRVIRDGDSDWVGFTGDTPAMLSHRLTDWPRQHPSDWARVLGHDEYAISYSLYRQERDRAERLERERDELQRTVEQAQRYIEGAENLAAALSNQTPDRDAAWRLIWRTNSIDLDETDAQEIADALAAAGYLRAPIADWRGPAGPGDIVVIFRPRGTHDGDDQTEQLADTVAGVLYERGFSGSTGDNQGADIAIVNALIDDFREVDALRKEAGRDE